MVIIDLYFVALVDRLVLPSMPTSIVHLREGKLAFTQFSLVFWKHFMRIYYFKKSQLLGLCTFRWQLSVFSTCTKQCSKCFVKRTMRLHASLVRK
ncbi:hypothetical protein CW304_21500 [Bacillus sp. UFRGS-B20]|nr:hypothetical protein CW304_21500 [Bacillus sp. UFRGS-B20]